MTNNDSPSRWFHESAIDNDERSEPENGNDSSNFDSEILGGEESGDTACGTSNDNPCSSGGICGSTTEGTFEGLGSLHSRYGIIISDCIKNVFGINKPKDWQLLLIQAMVFANNANSIRAICIRCTGDGKSLPIQCSATMRRFVSIVVVPLIAVGSDQASNVYYSSNSDASVYAEHLDSIRDGGDITEMINFLTSLDFRIASRSSIILYISPSTFTSNRWRVVLEGLISRKLVRFLCIDECHYITSAGRHFRPEFYESIRKLIRLLWDQCPMLFCSATMNKISIYHSSMMLHPHSPFKSAKDFPDDIGLDNPIIKLPIVDPLPSKFYTAVV